jgi:hypothetical protein
VRKGNGALGGYGGQLCGGCHMGIL